MWWFFVGRKQSLQQMPNASRKVCFFEVRGDGFDPDKIVGGGRPETPNWNDIPELLRNWAQYKASRFLSPPGVEAGTLLASGSQDPRCWWTLVDNIVENDYSLAAGRYKPQLAEKAPDDDPTQLIRETLAMERDIAIGLERLLARVESVE